MGAAALEPVAARADVLEIGSDGAHWIAGGAPARSHPNSAELAEGPRFPTGSEANTATSIQAVPQAYAATVQELSARYDLSPALIEAVVWQESRWHAAARSTAGALGLSQLMPGTAQSLGVNPDDPLANLEGGARYLRYLLDHFDGDIEKALAAYNAGPGRVDQAGGVPRIRETQTYVAAVMGRLSDHARR
ncbi:MAG TPA: lytic transglycosylase domain-containing protein [Croceibacterium sp.]|nr:lytic transglycosylase domain-containing protein [Croceibacterium sp.]